MFETIGQLKRLKRKSRLSGEHLLDRREGLRREGATQFCGKKKKEGAHILPGLVIRSQLNCVMFLRFPAVRFLPAPSGPPQLLEQADRQGTPRCSATP